nr:MAG TPA: Minor capsid protein from bacteriophage [Caudoviricetes sp.]
MDKYKLVSNSEQELIIKSLIDLIKTFPALPKSVKNIMFYDMLPDNECIGIGTNGGAKIFRKYIGNSYIGKYSFRMHYRYATKNSDERISKQSLLSTISEWLGGNTIINFDGTTYVLESYPYVSDKIDIIEISEENRTILVDKNKNGIEDSIIDLNLMYHKKG